MKRFFHVLTTMILISAVSWAQGTPKKAETKAGGGVEQALLEMERNWAAAALKSDPAPIDAILADSWSAISVEGKITTRAQSLARGVWNNALIGRRLKYQKKIKNDDSQANQSTGSNEYSTYKPNVGYSVHTSLRLYRPHLNTESHSPSISLAGTPTLHGRCPTLRAFGPA